MSFGWAVSAVVALGIGLAVLLNLWPRMIELRPYRFLVAALSVGVGLGLTTVGIFCWLLLFGFPDWTFITVEVAILILLAIGLSRRQTAIRSTVVRASYVGPTMHHTTARFVPPAFILTLACAMATFLALSAARPHGAWDAWMNWNLRARLIFRGGPEWQVAFSPLLSWSHPDYPLLVQGSVVRTWVYNGGEALAGQVMIAFLFTLATVVLVTAAVAALRGRVQGMLAGVVLLSTPFFIFHGISQYGDVPVGFFFLSTFVLLALNDQYAEGTRFFAALAGLTAGLAAWTKNEGVMFLVAIVLSGILTSRRAGAGRSLEKEALAFACGLLPMLLVIGYFKVRFAPPNDLMSTVGTGATLPRLVEAERYLLVAKAYLTGITRFGFNGLVSAVPLLIVYGLCVGVRPGVATKRWFKMTAMTVALMLAGHAVVFITTAEDVARLLNSSLERLLLQLWPSVVFSCFMVLGGSEDATEPSAVPVLPRADPA